MMILGDDGTLDTVIVCSDCGTEFRFTFDGEGEAAYHAFVEESKADADKHHVCGVGFACWASYLVNGDASGIDDDDRRAADAFADYLGGSIVDVSSETFFDTPDAGSKLAGDCLHYIAYLD